MVVVFGLLLIWGLSEMFDGEESTPDVGSNSPPHPRGIQRSGSGTHVSLKRESELQRPSRRIDRGYQPSSRSSMRSLTRANGSRLPGSIAALMPLSRTIQRLIQYGASSTRSSTKSTLSKPSTALRWLWIGGEEDFGFTGKLQMDGLHWFPRTEAENESA